MTEEKFDKVNLITEELEKLQVSEEGYYYFKISE